MSNCLDQQTTNVAGTVVRKRLIQETVYFKARKCDEKFTGCLV